MVRAGGDVPEEPKVGFEILQIASPKKIVVWINTEISEQEFEAIDLPIGWFKNQPREAEPDSGRFLRSPNAPVDGPLVEQEHFGHTWRHNATVVKVGVKVDQQRLLTASSVVKHHEITFNAGKRIRTLVSPGGEYFIRISRDANRSSDTPTLPTSWRIIETALERELTFQLPNPTLNIRADNKDSFQGPVPREILDFIDVDSTNK